MSAVTTGRIANLTRLRNSVNGNPRYIVTLVDGRSFTTAPDGSYVFGLEGAEYVGRFEEPAPVVELTVNLLNQIETIGPLISHSGHATSKGTP